MYNLMPSLGCDPEFFFVSTKTGHVVGSEKVFGEEGLVYQDGWYRKTEVEVKKYDGGHTVTSSKPSIFICDGVQAELNPRANTCRANLANEIGCCMRRLQDFLIEEERSDVYPLFTKQIVKVTKKELASLSPRSKTFGCAPSYNAHKNGDVSVIPVNPEVYQFRSAGGHLHFGDSTFCEITKTKGDPALAAMVLDVVVGNTCVLLDRDPLTSERRKVYGRAGEFRMPKYGLEYRTLSNFWLRSYPLMSFVFGMARVGISIVESTLARELLSMFDLSLVEKAINENDIDIAKHNLRILCRFLKSNHNGSYYDNPHDNLQLPPGFVPEFLFFADRGMDYWFKEDPMIHWATIRECHTGGWETFAEEVLTDEFDCLTQTEQDRYRRDE